MNDKRPFSGLHFFALLWMLFFSLSLLVGCAAKETVYQVPSQSGEKEVKIIATSFAFDPGKIKARKGDVLLLRVENKSGSMHNLTVKGPEGSLLLDLHLPPGETTEGRLSLTRAGIYEYFCDKPFHTAFGMKGKIEAATQ